MNLTIKKLPKSVQSLICASNQINSYTKAVQELVYNSLDADATSIAVRVHISEGSIQVVDNGCGIPQADFEFIGQNYMTSKLFDISTLKSAPNKYGFQGQSLANLAQITQTLKVTSRFHKSETTCMKIFDNGKAKLADKCSPRPSKGTTIEIKGFLHNLKIQKKSVNLINELQHIKTFLEHISLVHSQISISFRDDAINEILYKMHKNRDMYQTLSTLYEIDKTNVQELQVEKNRYKVKAFVGKNDVESRRHIIFLNGKIVPDSSLLHKKLNDNFKKHLRGGRMIKKNQYNDDENYILGNKIPFYFVFITCPVIDYEMTNTVLEFKNYGQINALLDKLVKFYFGDIILTKMTPKKPITLRMKQDSESTRNQIEKIMCKILGNHSKKPYICQMQNGVKGKLIKRRTKYQSKQKTVNSNRDKIKHKSPTCIDNTHYSSDLNVRQEQNITINNGITSKTHTKLINNSKIMSIMSTSPPKSLKTASKTKYSLSGTTNTPNKLRRNKNKRDKLKRNKKYEIKSLHNKFAQETDSVKRRCEIVAQESRRLIMNNNKNPDLFINENVHCTRRNFTENNKQIVINKRVRETIIHEYIPMPTKNYTERKIQNMKSFKSNYDLLQTIISSQITESDLRKEILNTSVAGVDRDRIETENQNIMNTDLNILTSTYNPDNGFLQKTLNNYVIQTPEQNFRPFLRKPGNQSDMPEHIEKLHEDKFRDLRSCNERIFDNIETQSLKETDNSFGSYDMNSMSSPNKLKYNLKVQTDTFDSHNLAKSIKDSPFPGITYQSHNYYDQDVPPVNNVEMNYKNPRNFITTQSRENFMMKTNFNLKNNSKRNKTNLFSKLFPPNTKNSFNKLFNTDSNTKKSIRESYTIEFTESNEHDYKPMNYNKKKSKNNNTFRSFDAMTQSMGYMFNNFSFDNESPNNPNSYCSPANNYMSDDLNYEPVNENTYTLTNSRTDDMLYHGHWDNNETYTIERSSVSNNESNKMEGPELRYTENQAFDGKDFVFISKSVEKNVDAEIVTNPIDVCETVLTDPVSVDKSRDFETSFERNNIVSNVVEEIGSYNIILNDSMNIDFPNYIIPVRIEQSQTKCQENHIYEEISHHFTIPDSIISEFNQSLVMTAKVEDKKTANALQPPNNDLNMVVETMEKNNELKAPVAFNLKNRLFFVPKGMSPIFEERQNKQQSEFNPLEEYYEDEIYNNFVDKVHNEVEIFKPRLDERNDMTMKNISKVNDKLHKDNASLKFDGDSIKTANILGQVDSKFIAATIKSKSNKGDEEFLVLFDQHAVHERIRLENNLADYVTGNQWKSVLIDEISFKMSRDNILYLHNYRDKFTQFGLEWTTIPNYNKISVTAIPEGILGKNPRPVDKIIAAVKNLIAEEINVMQMQRGCVSMYPKSIMALVFSEACRYAIKFGDHLSKSQCVELLNALSECKTPFQCAHGRPAMAVIMNIERNKDDYKANFSKLIQFKKI